MYATHTHNMSKRILKIFFVVGNKLQHDLIGREERVCMYVCACAYIHTCVHCMCLFNGVILIDYGFSPQFGNVILLVK